MNRIIKKIIKNFIAVCVISVDLSGVRHGLLLNQPIENKTPNALWEYEGYVDECKNYIWQEEFLNCDYDVDGKKDRLSRSHFKDIQSASYTINFGNGDILVTPKGWDTGFPHVKSGDLDGDKENMNWLFKRRLFAGALPG